ncbi:DNA-directed RNA polymerase III subunit RPC4 [Toxorhynchites rutilus septentrionalis]|uniref:DNA-directed RNA polymerase III subunit RPC4 n=1 Tax=Toxorhynchites rutilus septentrionalis TaxID=329112 RepID=UPI00247A075D|nr:DNA-directed RNA polymerase III subunit RPC4 [Toxorhynchites rutilus septentrionalis]
MESTIKIKQEPGFKTRRGNATVSGTPLPIPQPIATAVKSERLSSFRVPRDLTLGGLTNGRATKPVANKKVYTPNLNAVRNKDTNVKTASTGQKQRTKIERNKDSKAPAKNKGLLVQTSGIFSEGLAQRTLQRSKYEKYNNSSKEPGETIRRPVYRTEIKLDPEEERKRISDLIGDLDPDDFSDDTKKHEFGADMPIKLDNLDYKIRPSAVKTEIKDELMPKPEASDLLESIKESGKNNFFLLQLPDALPGKTDAESPATQEADNSPESARCTLRQLEEGYIGKILRYRSGKVKLQLGNTMFDLTIGMDSGFLQELVSISTNPTERSGNIINLATIKAKLNASPDWENLFKRS